MTILAEESENVRRVMGNMTGMDLVVVLTEAATIWLRIAWFNGEAGWFADHSGV